MKKSIFRSICLASLIVFIASMLVIMGALYGYFSKLQQSQLKVQTELVKQAVEHEGQAYFKTLSMPDVRITWIAEDGSVIYDNESDTDVMENHLDREEIREALSAGYGESSRYSSTLMRRQLYSAARLEDGTVIRLSGEHLTVLSLIIVMLQPILLVVIIAVGIALFLASRLSKKIVQPLNEMNLDEPKKNEGYEELKPLLERIDSQQNQLKRQASELRRKTEEFNAATANMNEGLILLNENGTILSINRTASRLLSATNYCVGKDIMLLDHSYEMQELLRRAKNGEHSNMTMHISGTDYEVSASPVITDETVGGIAVLIFDITEKEKAEKIRREFTANASHELKTPIQAISGSAELLKNHMVKEEDREQFYERIYNEAQRMIMLVDDIIGLSRLDEGTSEMKREDVDIYELAEDTVKSFKAPAAMNKVALSLEGESAVISGIPALLNGIIYNLTDNAVKYNRENGSVSLRVENRPEEVVLSVSDTGIGIPEADRERIFERFYRVEKSRSKAVGGTGLGLSIVKHAVKAHNARIELNSVMDGGTTVTVRFPKNS